MTPTLPRRFAHRKEEATSIGALVALAFAWFVIHNNKWDGFRVGCEKINLLNFRAIYLDCDTQIGQCSILHAWTNTPLWRPLKVLTRSFQSC